MSNPSPSKSQLWTTALAALGGFVIFVLILVVAYLPQKPAPLSEGDLTPEQRLARLAEMRGKEKTAATSYGWVDQEKRIVRLPIDRAVELTIADINAKK